MSGEDFTKRKEQLSSENKAKIFSMLTTRVPEAEIQKISMLMEDGLTVCRAEGSGADSAKVPEAG
ncbi:hypothetical protein LJK88_50795 [Paenibacillus sp. P26]|nr:hypothetical protein LJK88_50795 [Paenibacillus sp. P26]